MQAVYTQSNTVSDKVKGHTFYQSPKECISAHKGSPICGRVYASLKDVVTLIFYHMHKIYGRCCGFEAQMSEWTKPKSDGFSKKRVVVCLHGLNNNPAQFRSLVHEMKSKGLSETEIYTPKILMKGNAKLDEMVQPIFDEIAKWANKGGERELVLVGISNGGRIAKALDAKVSQSDFASKITNMRFVSIVGATKGTSLVNLANRIGLSCVMSKPISEEMGKYSERNKQLEKDWNEGLKRTFFERDYTFYASPHDFQVLEYDSTLPEVSGPTARYAIVPGHGHDSIVDAVSKSVAEIIAR